MGDARVAAWSIRAYRASDLDAVLDVWHAASVIAHSFLPEDFFETERVTIAEQWLPMAEVVVAADDDSVLGFLALVGDEVGAIFVHPGHQGRGAGRALMDHARALRGTLELEVFERNAIGRRFYADYGFEPVGESVESRTGERQLRLRLG
ncbi:MAG: GNAT family N-acetyltransferase [Ilumatobacter sp.]|nr:GNAT family N-acetyltransferase [Ilumatobacter sp.]